MYILRMCGFCSTKIINSLLNDMILMYHKKESNYILKQILFIFFGKYITNNCISPYLTDKYKIDISIMLWPLISNEVLSYLLNKQNYSYI